MSSFWRWFFLIIGTYFLVNLTFITSSPPVWPDETIMADFANNLAASGKLYSSLHGRMYQSLNGLFFYPPLLIYFYGFLIKCFGLSIYSQRLPAILAGLGLLVVLTKLSRHHRYPWLLPLLFLADFQLMCASRFSRPEIYILVLTFINIWLLQSKLVIKNALAGLLAVVSCLVHPLGILNLVLTAISYLFHKKLRLLLYLVGLGIAGILLWLFLLNWQIEPLLAVLNLQVQRRFSEPNFFIFLSQSQPVFFVYYHYGLLILSVIMVVLYKTALVKKTNLIMLLGLVLSWVIVFYGKESWYYVYPVAFLYYLISDYFTQTKNNGKNIFLGSLLALTLFFSLQLFRLDWNLSSLSYNAYAQNIVKSLKPNNTVFVSAIPDPYYALKTSSKNLRIFQFPPLPDHKQKYYDILNQSDYVVYTGIYDYGFDGLLKNYLEKNQETITLVGEPNSYQAQLIKLVPKNKRRY